MAERPIKDHSIYEPTTSELHPTITMPQGTQENGVEKGHEHRDIDARSLAALFGMLAVLTLVACLVLWGMHALLDMQVRKSERFPSKIVAETTDPPAPRLIPSPPDTRKLKPGEPLPGPWDVLAQERLVENRKLEQIGFIDPNTGAPRIPDEVLTAVEAGNASKRPAGARPAEEMGEPTAPSDSSGGTSLEFQLK